jgi:hypothetical protein
VSSATSNRQHTQISRFPQYSQEEQNLGIWTESYGGHFGPAYAEYFEEQIHSTSNLTQENVALPIRIDTLGVINGWFDLYVQVPYYPVMAYNNTYDLQIITLAQYEEALGNWSVQGGCKDQALECKALLELYDSLDNGSNSTVNAICSDAYLFCYEYVYNAYTAYGVSIPRNL